MNRQYIGARYVPKFYEGSNGNEWDVNVPYEPLTIVTYLNNSYTSKKPVPANIGAPNLNLDYWVLTSNYSAQIEQYRETVETYQESVEEYQRTVDELMSDDLIIIGDSYGVDASAGGSSWASIIETWFSDLNIYRSTVGGTGFGSDVYMDDNNLTMLENLTVSNKLNVRNIVVVGGANDANLISDTRLTESVLRVRIDAFMNYCKTNYPNATVKVAFVGWRSDSTVVDRTYIETASIYQTEVEKFNNAKYYTSGEVILHDLMYINTTDKVHPTQEGSNILAQFVASMINNSEFNFVQNFSFNRPTTAEGYTFNGNNNWYVITDNNITELTVIGEQGGNYLDIRPSTAVEYNGTQAILGNIIQVPHMVRGIYGNYGLTVVDGLCGITGKGAKSCKILLLYQDGYFAIRIFGVEDGASGDTIGNVLLPMFKMTFLTRLN